jgi:hypothetical protein
MEVVTTQRFPRFFPEEDATWGGAKGIAPRWQVLLFLFMVLLVFSRRPSDLLHAQFYAEDGKRWFAQAYNDTWLRSLAIPDASYLQVLPRLFAGLALLFPFRDAPLIMNLSGACTQVLPVTALLSARCSTWGSLRTRILMGIVYLADPNASEIHVVLTNAQWHYALFLLLLAFALPPRTLIGKIGECCLFILGIFSGPFGIVLLPLLVLYGFLRRQRWSYVTAACLAVGALVQLHSIAIGARQPHVFLGANAMLFIRLVGGDLFLTGPVGQGPLGERLPAILVLFVFVGGLIVVAAGTFWGPLGQKLFLLYSSVWFLAAIKSPMIAGPPLWRSLLEDPGGRYYFFPTIVFLWSAVYCVRRVPVVAIRYAGVTALLVFVLGAVRKWEYPAFTDYQFAMYARQFDNAPAGQHVIIPIFPGWKMDLLKH